MAEIHRKQTVKQAGSEKTVSVPPLPVKRQEKRGEKRKQKGEGIFFGVAVLTAANLLVKLLGFAYKVPLNALLGDEMANVNAAYAVYALLYTVSTAGIPGAVSLAVSRAKTSFDGKRVKMIFTSSFVTLLALGFFLSLLLFSLAKPLSMLNSGGDSYLCMLAISPALFFAAAAGVLRGYFQGFSLMTPTALSEVLEALGKAVCGIGLVLLSLRVWDMSKKTAAALSVLGITLGVMAGALSLAFTYLKRGQRLTLSLSGEQKNHLRHRTVLRGVLLTAIPITLSSLMMSLSGLLDATLTRPLLGRYYGDEAIAKAVYSDYSTGAVTLYNLPAVLISPITAAMIPYIASALERKAEDVARHAACRALKVASLLSFPCAFSMSALASPILTFVFRGDDNMAEHAGSLLSVLSVAVFFAAVLTVTSAALQGGAKERMPIFSLVAGITVKMLTMTPLTLWLGKIGIPLSTLLFYLTVCLLNLYFVRTYMKIKIGVADTFVRPALCAALSAALGLFAYRWLFPATGLTVALLFSLFLSFLLYALFLLFFHGVSEEEIMLLPFGKRIISLWKKRKSQKMGKI